MIISPPFLPPNNGAGDAAWLELAMAQPTSRLPGTAALEGSFPLSHNLSWHNGIHLQAPQGSGSLPVRAIADGQVIFVNEPTPPNNNVEDDQNYNPFDRGGAKTAAWTDNGCVIVEHRTEIGAEGVTPIEVVFYSLYMHLSEIGKNEPAPGQAKTKLKAGDAIWRKDELGKPGRIYGDSGQIHFEISCDEANLKRLLGRAPDWVGPAVAPGALPVPMADGRADSVFGSMYIYLPATTSVSMVPPKTHMHQATTSTLGTPVWVRMTFSHTQNGDCAFETFDERGKPIGKALVEPDVEYNLYKLANACHDTLPATDKANSSPSLKFLPLRSHSNDGK